MISFNAGLQSLRFFTALKFYDFRKLIIEAKIGLKY